MTGFQQVKCKLGVPAGTCKLKVLLGPTVPDHALAGEPEASLMVGGAVMAPTVISTKVPESSFAKSTKAGTPRT